jgi:alcohol dehydrogenase class IV
MLPHVVRFNGQEHGDWYRDLLASSSGTNGAPRPSSGASGLAEFLSQLTTKAGLPGRLADCGVDRAQLTQLADEASKQWTSGFNPRPATAADLFRLYQEAF